MADDGNGNNELARLRQRQQPDNKAEVAASQSAPSTAPPDGDGDPTVDEDAVDSLEQRVLGAVRQAVTDVMQDGKQPTDLPTIDMDFVATSTTPTGAKGARRESINPMSDSLTANKPIGEPADLDAPVGASRALTLAIACTSLGFIVLAAVFTLRGNDWDQLSLAAVDQTDRPVAGATSQSEVARLSSSDTAASPSSPQDALTSKEPLGEAETQSVIRLLAKENAEREENERKRLKIEEVERLRSEAKRVAEEKTQRAATERKRLDDEEAERQRRAIKRIAEEKAQREATERMRLDKEEAERQRRAAKRVAEEKAQHAATERKRLEKEEAERQRRAARRIAEQEAQRVAAEQKRLEKEEAERQRLAILRAAVKKARDEVTQRKRQLEAQDERLRIASLRETQKEAQRKVAERKQREALVAERAALPKSLAQIGVRAPREIEDLATEAKKRLQSERVLAERLTSILKDAKQARRRSNSPPSSQEELPLAWTVEEKVRLKLEQLLNEINKEEKVATAPHLRDGPTLVRKRVTLQLKESNLKITGVLQSQDTSNYIILLPSNELMTLPIEHFDCIGPGCPPKRNE